MKAKLALAGILFCLGSGASYAQYARDVTSEGQATINEEQKLGPDTITRQYGNERVTRAAPWRYGQWVYRRKSY